MVKKGHQLANGDTPPRTWNLRRIVATAWMVRRAVKAVTSLKAKRLLLVGAWRFARNTLSQGQREKRALR